MLGISLGVCDITGVLAFADLIVKSCLFTTFNDGGFGIGGLTGSVTPRCNTHTRIDVLDSYDDILKK